MKSHLLALALVFLTGIFAADVASATEFTTDVSQEPIAVAPTKVLRVNGGFQAWDEGGLRLLFVEEPTPYFFFLAVGGFSEPIQIPTSEWKNFETWLWAAEGGCKVTFYLDRATYKPLRVHAAGCDPRGVKPAKQSANR